jgi:hypothetical protein
MPIIDYFKGIWIGQLHQRGQRRDPTIHISDLEFLWFRSGGTPLN